MRNILSLIEKNRNIRKRMIIVFLILSVLVVALIISFLIRPAYSAVKNTDCNAIEHTHISKCYSEHKKCGESVLACSSDLSSEMLSHIHDDFCYDENGKIICPLSEYQHVHTDDCYDENGVQICGAAFHQHSEECFRILGENDSALVLECGKESHIHSESCYPEISSASLKEMQEDFAETQSIEPEFEETEIIESEMDIFKPVTYNEITLFDDGEDADTDSGQGFELQTDNIKSVTLKYKNENGTWVVVNNGMPNVPANTSLRIEVSYKNVDRNEIKKHNNQIVYSGIPKWMNPNSSGNIYDGNGNVVASISVKDGNAVITFTQDYLDSLVGDVTIDGTFNVEGSADWRQIDTPSNPDPLPYLGFNFEFEDNLSAKYGNFKVEKHNTELVEKRDENGKITNTYLKYELKVKSLESSKVIPEICITDILSTDNRLNLNDVIMGNGYVGVTNDKATLLSSESSYNPYETVTGVNEYNHGTVVLDNNNNVKWEIDNLKPNEERTLVYYVELNEKYVGSGSAGALRNEARPESNGFKKESVRDEFIPKADVDVTKAQVRADVNDSGNGTIDYTVIVTAKSDNSYTITDACIKDSFRDGMADYVDKSNNIAVTINSGNKQEIKSVAIGNDGFTVPVPELKRGESVTITYSVPVKGIFSKINGDVSFSNHASFVGGNKDGKLKNGYVFKGSGVTTTVYHNQWMRKLNGQTVNTDTRISFDNGNEVYNYNGSKQSGITEFTVPQNAQEYIVVVNEDGTWDMSNTNFVDNFYDNRIAYTGYLKIEEFDQTDEIPEKNSLDNNAVLSALNKQRATKTVWVNINGRNNFDVKPTTYGLTNGNKVYRLTYYAAVDPKETNIKNIVVTNGFMIEGTIGTGDNVILFNGVHTVVSSTLTGNASYDFDKESIFHEKKPDTSGNGDIYWVIRANGTLPKGLHIQDQPDGNSMSSDSLVGVYMGDKDYDFSEITSSEELNTSLSEMDKLEEGTNKYFYNLQTISSLADLNGKDFAIFSRKKNWGDAGYLTRNKDGDNQIRGRSLSSQVSFGTDVETDEVVQMWHFQRVNQTDKFYIYYTDSSGNNHYMHISQGSATISTEQEPPLTVRNDNNLIKIADSSGNALNWCGGDNTGNLNYSSWNDDSDHSNWHYLGTLDNNPRYSYKPRPITNVNDLNGKQFAIITPGTPNSGLLVGGNSDTSPIPGEWYTSNFSDDPPTFTRKAPLQKWTFQKIDGVNDEFNVYYTDANEQRHYLSLGNSSATTTDTPSIVKISCTDGKIHLKTPDGNYALDWYGGGEGAQNHPDKAIYSTWNNTENSNNQLHYVVTEAIISANSSNFDYSWSAHDSKGNIKINRNIVIDQNKSMYIVLRSHPNEALEGFFSKTFDNTVGIMDDASDQFDLLDNATYTYHPNFPLRKEGMVAAYWDGNNWTIQSDPDIENNLSGNRDAPEKLKFNSNNNYTPGLYVEWLLNVNWDGTINGDAILTDYLDHKMEPVSVKEFWLGATSSANKPVYNKIVELENDPDWTPYDTHGIPFYYNEKTGELKLAVGNLQKATSENNSVVNLQLICRVTDPDVIFNGTNSTLKNTADLTKPDGTFIGKHTDSHVIKPTYSIKKDVGNQKDSEGIFNTNKLTYKIEINPLAEDLIAGGDTLPVLIDEMSSNMELMGTVDVFEKVGDSETKLTNIKYSTVSNTGNKQIIFDNLPDEKHLIIRYKTKVNVKQNEIAEISNTAYWKDYDRPSSQHIEKDFKYALGGSVIAHEDPIVVINKLDFYNNGITLGGAEFEIRKVNTDGTIDADVITAVTGNDGKIRFAADNDNQLSCDTVYQLKETKAPTDYVLDDTPMYFMVVKGNHGYNIDANGQMIVDEKTVDVIIENISNSDPDLELTVYNKKACVRVNKVFLDEDESEETINPRDKFPGTYRFGLYYSVPTPNTLPEQILSITYSDNGISYTLDGKETNEPVFTKARAGDTNFVYELNEKNEPIINGQNAYLNGYSFDVTYSANSVVVPQKIDLTGNLKVVTITNKYHPIYMPTAGGIGLKKYYKISFFALMILSTLAAAVKVRRKCK